MPPFDKHELEKFLTTGSHIMKLATLTTEGWPSVNPVWYQYDGGDFLVAGRTKARWVANIRNDPRVSLCIDTNNAPYSRVLVEGSAEVADPAWFGDWEPWSIRYLGQEAGHRYYEETKHVPRALVRIVPRTVTSWAGGGWHPRYTDD